MKKYTKRYLYYNLISSIVYSIIPTFILCVNIFFSNEDEINLDSENLIYFFITYIVIELSIAIFHIVKYFFTFYEIKDDLIVLKKGIIFKREKSLKYEKMHAVDTKQNIIQKLFGVKRLAIDSGSTTRADFAEIVIFEDNETTDKIEKLIKQRMAGNFEDKLDEVVEEEGVLELEEEKQENILYQYSTKDKILFAFMTSFTTFLVSIITFGLISFIIEFLITDQETFWEMLIAFAFMAIASVIFTIIFSLLFVLIRYYNYKVIAKEDHLVITHGLLTKVSHMLHFKKIKAIKVEEGFIKRLFKYASIKLEVVGFGERASSDNNNQQLNYLIPLCKRSQVRDLIDLLNLDFKYENKQFGSPKKTLRYFLTLPLGIYSIIYLSLFPIVRIIPTADNKLIWVYGIIYLLILVTLFLIGYLRYKNSGIYFDDMKTIVYYGSFNKKSLIILNKNITEIEVIDTYLRSKRDIASYKIHYFNNAYKNDETAEILTTKIAEDLKKVIKY